VSEPLQQTGVVSEFDEAVGLGEVTSGAARYPFHCTRIGGGSRTIEPGTEVTFFLMAGHLGGWEAAAVQPCRLSPGSGPGPGTGP